MKSQFIVCLSASGTAENSDRISRLFGSLPCVGGIGREFATDYQEQRRKLTTDYPDDTDSAADLMATKERREHIDWNLRDMIGFQLLMSNPSNQTTLLHP